MLEPISKEREVNPTVCALFSRSVIAKLKNDAVSKKSSVDIIALIMSIFYTSGI